MTNEINEVFELMPLRLRPIGLIDGETIKSNDAIINTIKGMIKNSPSTKDFYSNLEMGIDSGTILIGYEDGSKLKFLMSRWRDKTHKDAKKGYVGYTSTKDHKIAIILDENVNIFGKAIRNIPHTLTHECLHLAAYQLWRQFMSANLKSKMVPFYKELFASFLPEFNSISDRELSKVILEISKMNDGVHYGKPDIQATFNMWYQLVRKVANEETADRTVLLAMVPYYKYYFKSLNPKFEKDVKTSLKSYMKAYQKIGVRNIFNLTIPNQEIIFPSEIICITDEYNPSSENVRVLRNLNFGG